MRGIHHGWWFAHGAWLAAIVLGLSATDTDPELCAETNRPMVNGNHGPFAYGYAGTLRWMERCLLFSVVAMAGLTVYAFVRWRVRPVPIGWVVSNGFVGFCGLLGAGGVWVAQIERGIWCDRSLSSVTITWGLVALTAAAAAAVCAGLAAATHKLDRTGHQPA